MMKSLSNLGKAAFAIAFGITKSFLVVLITTMLAALFGGIANNFFDYMHLQHFNFMMIGGALAFSHLIWKET